MTTDGNHVWLEISSDDSVSSAVECPCDVKTFAHPNSSYQNRTRAESGRGYLSPFSIVLDVSGSLQIRRYHPAEDGDEGA